jgi:hypothetical protein
LRYLRVGGRGLCLGAGKNSKPEKCLKMPQNATRQVHLVMMASDHFPPKNDLLSGQRMMKRAIFLEEDASISGCRSENAVLACG